MTGPRRPNDELETPVRRLAGADERRRRATRGLAAIAAVLVVAAGIGLAESAAPAPTDGATATGDGPTPRSSATASGSLFPGLGCRPVAIAPAPVARLWSTSEDRRPLEGLPAPSPVPLPSGRTAADRWLLPDTSRAVLQPEGATLVLVADDDACIARAQVSYAPATGRDPGAVATRAETPEDGRPGVRLDIGALPRGDWVVRIATSFVAVAGGAAIETVTFHRVVAGDAAVVVPFPQVTPAVACGPDPVSAPLPALVLVVAGGPPITPPDAAGDPPTEIRLGDAVEVRTVDDRCARGWTIQVRDDRGNSFLQESFPNAVDDPLSAAQNRWTLSQLLLGEAEVVATIRLGRDRSVTRIWPVRVTTPGLPNLRVTGPDGATAEAVAGCGQFWFLDRGTTAAEPCDELAMAAELGRLVVPDGRPVEIDVDGWTIESWLARCGGSRPLADGGQAFVLEADCSLGEGSEPGPFSIVPWPGEQVILLGVTLGRDGLSAYGNFFVGIDVRG